MVIKHIHRISLKKQIFDLVQDIRTRRNRLKELRNSLKRYNKDHMTDRQRKNVGRAICIVKRKYGKSADLTNCSRI